MVDSHSFRPQSVVPIWQLDLKFLDFSAAWEHFEHTGLSYVSHDVLFKVYVVLNMKNM